MKKLSIPAVIVLILGLVVAIGSQSFLGPCVHEDGSFGACHWAGQAALGVGGLLSAMALVMLILPASRPGLFIGAALASLLGLLTPGTLIALCGMATMRCRMIMKPAMMILFALALMVSVVGLILERGRLKA